MRAILLAIALAIAFVPKVHAQPAPSTGLGMCIDFIASASSTLTTQVNGHTAQRLYGTPARYDPVTKVIYVPPYACDSYDVGGLYRTIGYLSHELGHHYSGVPDVAPPINRDQFVEKLCNWEASAVRNNWTVRTEILVFTEGSETIPVIAQNESTMVALLTAGTGDPALGSTFCDNNTNSSGKTYTQFFRDYYDANYPQ